MQEIEFKRYEEIGNWDFSDIKYTVEQDNDWDFYKEISKYSKSNSLILGGEQRWENEVKMKELYEREKMVVGKHEQ